ncbi:MAG: hypothetical protein JXB19_01650 [Bacteroidales bacterium]|nr:hypothetical protein [Bacteroidales bacterium]
MLSFNLEEFLGVLEDYNLFIWPLQIIAYLAGILALTFSFIKIRYSHRIILSVLSFYWLWNGIVFCPFFWAPTYKLAYVFGAFCTMQGILFLIGVFKSNISVKFHANLYSITGLIFIVYAMAGYQVFGHFLGHVYPSFFPFGLVPCPTAIFTFGIFLLTDQKLPKYYLIIPFVVAMGGFLAASKGILEDLGLIVAGILGTILIFRRDKNIDPFFPNPAVQSYNESAEINAN